MSEANGVNEMGMGVVSDSDFISEKSKLVNEPEIHPAEIVKDEIVKEKDEIIRGRGLNNREVPNSLRKLIGEESEINGRQSALEIAKQFGISPSSVSAYANGSTSTASYNERKESIVSHLNESKLRVQKRARNKMMMALSHITNEKLEGAKVRDLAGIAKDMSAVIKNMEPESAESNKNPNSPNFIFYAPQFSSESKFDIIHTKE